MDSRPAIYNLQYTELYLAQSYKYNQAKLQYTAGSREVIPQS